MMAGTPQQMAAMRQMSMQNRMINGDMQRTAMAKSM
jgi:hypothetical protein